MTFHRITLAVTLALAPAVAQAQDEATVARVMAAVRAAVTPALPFPASDALGSLPADGKHDGPWIVKPHQPGDRTIEVLANPLNEEHQRRATLAMAQIEQSIEAAQRRADAQFEHAMAEAKRTGRSQEVDGVTLNDEGLAGARIDAESHVTIEVTFNRPAAAGVAITSTPSSVYRDDGGTERFREAQSIVSVGPAQPVTGAGISSLAITLRGNEALIAELLRKSDWNRLLELLQ